MKLTKKILSIVLAVALVLGTVAVATHAAEYDGISYEGSELVYTIKSDKTDENGVTNVKIGETINISVYISTNYYTGTTGGEFFLWTAGIFDALENSDVSESGIALNYANTYTNPANVNSYPSTHGTSAYVGLQILRAYADGKTVPVLVGDEQLLYTISLTVKDDESLIGKTATFEMPAASVKSATLPGKKGMINQGVSGSATSATSAKAYAEKTDVSAATLTMNIVTDVETVYCDYSALEKAYGYTPAYSAEFYDADLYKEWEEESLAAKTILESEKLVLTDANQLLINNAAKSLTAAYNALVPAFVDLTNLNDAIANCDEPEYGEELYDATAWATWTEKLAAAKDAAAEYADAANTAENQAAVLAAETELEDAFAALVPDVVDLTDLLAAIADCDEPAYGEELYDAAAWTTWTEKLAAAKDAAAEYDGAANTAENKAAVLAAETELEDAFAALVPAEIDLTDLLEAINTCDEAEYAEEYYDAAAWATWTEKLAAAKDAAAEYEGAVNTAENKAAVLAAETELEEAFAALVPAFVDLTNLNDAIANCDEPEYGEELYDATAWATWTEKLAAAKDAAAEYADAANTAENQAAVLAAETELEDAFAALIPATVDLTDLLAAIDDCDEPEYGEDLYDAAAWATWTEKLAAAKDAAAEYEGAVNTAENKAAVLAAETELEEAFAALVPAELDLTDLLEAIGTCGEAEYAEEYYDAAAWATWTEKLAAAKDAAAEYEGAVNTAENKAAVLAAETELEEAFAALVPSFVSYEKVEKALADFSATEYPAFVYTADSWKDYSDALAAAKDVNENRPEVLPAATAENQAEIDAYATDLEEAYNNLVVADSSIISVTAMQKNYVVNAVVNHKVYIEGSGYQKVQIRTSTGNTITYDRKNANVKSITVDDQGNETWVIALRIHAEEFTAYARAKTKAGWELGYRAFDSKCLGEDLEVKSAAILLDGEVVTEFLTKDVVTGQIVTGADVIKVQLKNPVSGTTTTYSTPSAVNEDGTKVWTFTRKYTTEKEYDFDIMVKSKKVGWVDSEVNLQFTATKAPIPQVPSTGNVDDAVYSVTLGAKRMLRGSTQTFEVVTDISAKSVRILNASGNVVATIKSSASSDETTKTWTLDKVYNTTGDYNYTVEALYGSTWLADDDGVATFTVIY